MTGYTHATTTSATPDISSYERSAVVHALWLSITVLGSLGNMLVIYTMARHGERSATNCYIINLAVSDFAVLTVIVPFTIAMFTSFDWLYGEVMCKVTVYLIFVMLQATCLTLTAMTVDRYYAIVHPITSIRDRTPRAAVLVCIATWLVSSFVCIPFLIYSRLNYTDEPSGKHVYCVSVWPSATWHKVVTIAFVLSTYVIPLLFIIVCYSLILKHVWINKIGLRREMVSLNFERTQRSSSTCLDVRMTMGPVTRRRRKVAKMVFVIVLMFAITWLPIHVFNLCFILIKPFPKTTVLYNVKIMCHTLSYLNSCLNPFVYGFLGDGFRRAFRKSFPKCTERNQVAPLAPTDGQGVSCTVAETRLGVSRDITRNTSDV